VQKQNSVATLHATVVDATGAPASADAAVIIAADWKN